MQNAGTALPRGVLTSSRSRFSTSPVAYNTSAVLLLKFTPSTSARYHFLSSGQKSCGAVDGGRAQVRNHQPGRPTRGPRHEVGRGHLEHPRGWGA